MLAFLPFIMRDKRTCLCFRSTQQRWLGPNPHRAQGPAGGEPSERRGGVRVWDDRVKRWRCDRGEPGEFEVFCEQLNPGQANRNETVEGRGLHAPKRYASVGQGQEQLKKGVFKFKKCFGLLHLINWLHVSIQSGCWLKRGIKTTMGTVAITPSFIRGNV